jgi:uncharacterized membrane protein YjgN (DUF898 family)
LGTLGGLLPLLLLLLVLLLLLPLLLLWAWRQSWRHLMACSGLDGLRSSGGRG